MKIFFALSSFFPEHTAGTETYVLYIAKELQNMGFEVAVTYPSAGKYLENYKYQNIDVYPFFVPLKISTQEMNGLSEPSGIKEFSEILDKLKPDVFHLHSLSRSFHAEHIRIAKQKGIKTVFTGHLGSTFCVNGDIQLYQKETCDVFVSKKRCLTCFIKKTKHKGIVQSKILASLANTLTSTPLKYKFPAFNLVKNKINQHKLINQYSDVNIAIAPWLERAFKINNLDNIKLVNQGINSKFINSEEKQNIIDGKIELIFVGRMHPDKGIHLLIKALEDYNKKINLTIITLPFKDELDFYEKVKHDYKELGYNNWLENLTQIEVAEKLDLANMLVLPSTKNEAAPLVILEAFAKNIPVLGSSYVAIPDMVKHNYNGLIFKNGDILSLKEQLQRLIIEPNLISKLSKNITPPRTFEDVAIDMKQIYKNILT